MCPKCTTMIKTIHLNFENEIGILKKSTLSSEKCVKYIQSSYLKLSK